MEKFNVDLLKNESTIKWYVGWEAELLDQSTIEIKDNSDLNDNQKSLKMCITSAADQITRKGMSSKKRNMVWWGMSRGHKKKNEIYSQLQQRWTRVQEEDYEP